MDPFGNIPVFLPILRRVPAERRRAVLVRELLLALIVIVGFIFGGRYVMSFLGLKGRIDHLPASERLVGAGLAVDGHARVDLPAVALKVDAAALPLGRFAAARLRAP